MWANSGRECPREKYTGVLWRGFIWTQVELDIDPQKGWQTEDLVVPAGLHITSRLSTDKVASEPEGESAERPSVYPFGVGGVLMNGCYGTGYEPGDPCYSSQITTTLCLVNLIICNNIMLVF